MTRAQDDDMTDTLERLAAVLAKDPQLAPGRVTPDALLDSLGIDSLGLVDVMWNVEDAFGIKVPLRMPELHDVADLVAYVDRLVAEQGASVAKASARATP